MTENISFLSIDSGGVRGIIPVTILDFLESQLQLLDGEDARIADYFDVIAGSETGGITAAMLTAPNQNNRPLFTAKEIKDFYLKHSSKIFSQSSGFRWALNKLKRWWWCIPKYSGKYLHQTMNEIFGGLRLHQTLTKVIIPAFDLIQGRPWLFCSFQVTNGSSLDARIADICIGTSATHTYFPTHYFETENFKGYVKKFGLIDGSAVTPAPDWVALKEVKNESYKNLLCTSASNVIKQMPILFISLGTGHPSKKFKDPNMLLQIEVCSRRTYGDDGMTRKGLRLNPNFLRVQEYTLSAEVSSFDISTKKNLDSLVNVGEGLLKKPVMRMNYIRGLPEPAGEGTYEQALIKFARELSELRRLRKISGLMKDQERQRLTKISRLMED